MATTTFTAGILRVNEMRVLLHKMELPFSEVKGFAEVVFIVRMSTSRHLTNVNLIRHKIVMENRQAREEEYERAQAERHRLNARKLKRLNVLRRLTFRKPLKNLPLQVQIR